MTRILVRGIPARQPWLDYLAERIDDAEWFIDTARDPLGNFLFALAESGDDGTVHMEEDVILTVGFRAKLEAAIAEHPGSVIQFFCMRRDDTTIGSRWARMFVNTQCFYLPPSYGPQVVAYENEWRGANPSNFDRVLRDWLEDRKERHWLHIPNLVQHRIGPTSIGKGRNYARLSLTFVDPDE